MNPNVLMAAARILEYLRSTCSLKTSINKVESNMYGQHRGFSILATVNDFPLGGR